jgi:beta-xylosidase
VAWPLSVGPGRSADKRILHKRLIIQWPKQSRPGKCPNGWTTRRQNYRWPTPQRRTKEQLRVRQVEAGQILWRVNFDTTVAGGLEEELDMIIQSDVEAQWNIHDINIAWITIVIAVSNTKSELPAAQG